MLDFFERYRNNPKRTVITMKTKRTFYLLKRKDVVSSGAQSSAFGVSNNTVNTLDEEPKIIPSSCDGYTLERDKCITNEAQFAFKSKENICNLDDCCADDFVLENSEPNTNFKANCGKKCDNKQSKLAGCKMIKHKEKKTRGALVCEKEWCVLLCDLVAAMAVMVSIICLMIKLKRLNGEE